MLNFAFIGCGNVARFHADVIYGMNHQISAVCARQQSPNIIPFAEKYKITHTYDNYIEMLDKEKPDAVIVAVSWNQTEHIIEDILKIGIPCLVEKPVALSSARLEQIISSTMEFNKSVLVAYNRRFYDFIPLLKKAIESMELLSIELNMPEAVEFIVKLHSSSIIDYILLYMSSHWLDLMMYLIGDVRIEYMHRSKSSLDNPCSSYNGILYSLKYNIPIHLQANFNAPSQISMTFNFSDTIYKLCPIEMLTIYKGMDRIEADNKIKIRRYMPKVLKSYEVNADYKPGFYPQMESFIETCVKHSRINEVGCTLSDALRVTKLCEQIKG
jgi:predicted dehydrogenase